MYNITLLSDILFILYSRYGIKKNEHIIKNCHPAL